MTECLLHDLAGVLDPTVLGHRAARRLREQVRLPMVSVALRDRQCDGQYEMRGAEGAHTPAVRHLRISQGRGLGGRAVAEHRVLSLEDYRTDPAITADYRPVVRAEDLRGMTAVPVESADGPVAILYGARRDRGRPDDRTVDTLSTAGRILGPLFTTALAAEQHVRRRVAQERQRIAGALHDDVGQLLFGINAAARRAHELNRSEHAELGTIVDRIEQLAGQATERLRDCLHDLAPAAPEDRLPVAAQRDLDEFSARTGIVAHLLVPGEAVPAPPSVETALLACLRQALFNIERHAVASVVLATLDFQPGRLGLVVQDDGQGPPPGFEPSALPDDGQHWGYASMLRQVEQLGGTVRLEPAEEGGAQLRMQLPLSR